MDTTRVRGVGTFGGSDILLFTLLGAAGIVSAGTWLSGQVAGLVFNLGWPDSSPDDAFTIALAVPRHLDDPRQAWPEPGQLPGPIAFYATTLAVFAAMAAALVVGVRWWRGDRPSRGMATARELNRSLTARAVLATASRIRPTLKGKPKLSDVAVSLGAAGRRPLYAGLESSVLVAAAPRQGKTSQVIIPWLRSFPGAAVVTSVRTDVLEATATLRPGTSWVMELTGALRWPHRVAWSPVVGCERFDTALRRADVMIQVGKQETADSSNAGFFGMTATNLMAAWLHTAALCGKTMDDVRAWSTDPGDDRPVKLLRTADRARDGVLKLLDGFYRQPDATRANLWATVQTGTASLLGEAAAAVFCRPVADSFDIDAFLRSGTDTIYLLVDEQQADALAPLVTAFVNEIITAAKRLAMTASHGRLDPPLGLILDEVTNVVPLPDLPDVLSYAAGSGIFTVAVLQNMAAAEKRWRAVGRKMLWANATVKIALGGLAGEDLDDFSHLAGTYRETLLVPQRQGSNGVNVQATVVDRKAMPPEAIRTLDGQRREALVIHATTPPVKTRMVRHYESADAAAYAAAVDAARALMSQQPAGDKR